MHEKVLLDVFPGNRCQASSETETQGGKQSCKKFCKNYWYLTVILVLSLRVDFPSGVSVSDEAWHLFPSETTNNIFGAKRIFINIYYR